MVAVKPKMKNRRILIFLIPVLIINIILYFHVFSYGFVFDDWHLIREYSYKELTSSFKGSWSGNSLTPNYFRPFFIVYNYFTYKLWGADAFAYHAANIITHIANIVTIFFIMYYILTKIKKNAAIATSIFSIIPYVAMPVSFISDIGTPLSFFFFGLSFLLFLIYNDFRNNDSAKRIAVLTFSYLSFLIGLLVKELTATLPLIITLYTLVYFGKKRDKWKNTAGYWIIFVVYFIYRSFALKGLGLSSFTYGTNFLQDIFIKIATFMANSFFMIIPFAEIEVPFWFYAVDLLFVAVLVFNLIKLIFSKNTQKSEKMKIYFFLGWTIICLLPTYASLGARLLYYAGVGFSALVFLVSINIITRFKEAKQKKKFQDKVMTGVSIAVIFLFLIISLYGNITYQRDYRPDSKFALSRDIYAYKTQYLKGLLMPEQGMLLTEKLQSYGIVENGVINENKVVNDDRKTLRRFITKFVVSKINVQNVHEYNI